MEKEKVALLIAKMFIGLVNLKDFSDSCWRDDRGSC